MKILYVEDNPLDIDMTCRKFKKKFSHVHMDVVRSQAEALNVIKKPDFSTYDLVLTDMHLQDGSGITVLSHIRGRSLSVAVVILTGQGDEEAAVAALKAGADDYVVKKKGYLDTLPFLLEKALLSYQKTKDKGVKSFKVLYIEHDQIDMDLTKRHLNRYAPHIRLEIVSDLSEIDDLLNQADSSFQYDAVLLDYRLPQENALEVLKRIKQFVHLQIPVILVTGQGDEEIAVEALKLGAFDYVVKNQGYLFKLPSIIENAYYNDHLKREREALAKSEIRLNIINRINEVFLTVPDKEMYNEVLNIVLEVMESRYGVFGYMDENGSLVVPSMTRYIWNECDVDGKKNVFPHDKWDDGSRPCGISEEKIYHTNTPSEKNPDGHNLNQRHISLPIIHKEKVIGLFQVAEKETDYTDQDVELLRYISRSVAPVLDARIRRERLEKARNESQAALQKSEQMLTAMFGSARDGIVTADAQTRRFVRGNRAVCQMLGCSHDELIKLSIDDIHPPEELPRVIAEFDKQFRDEIKTALDIPIKRRDGSIFYADINAAYFELDGSPHILCIFRDITDRKKMEEQLVRSQKLEAIGTLAGGVAHDFNNMLSVILGHAELISFKVEPRDPVHSDVEAILKAAKHSAVITRQLLGFARKQPINPKAMDLNKAVERSFMMLRRLIGEDIDLVRHSETKLWPVKMDPGQVDQILTNLCVNARDAVGGVGKVVIETKNVILEKHHLSKYIRFEPGEYVMLAVRDNGCGMDKETLANVFEPFFTTKKPGKGTGLGLSTVYGIVKQNQGVINVDSEIGKGTIFTVYFPRHKKKEDPENEEVKEETSKGRGETILIVEDEPAVLKLTQKILEKINYVVLATADQGEAVKIAQEYAGEIHLILTDVVMPHMSGKELAGRILKIRPNIKVLFMSGYTPEAIIDRKLLDKSVRYLRKPFMTDQLARTVREELDKS